MNTENKKNILVTTSSFFRDIEDDIFGGGNFVFQLSKRFVKDFNVFILAPGSEISIEIQKLEGTVIYRFKQFFLKKVDLAFGPGILSNIESNFLLIFVLPFFIFNQFKKLTQICRLENIEIIHSHWIFPQGLVAVFYKLLINPKVKIILTIHGSDYNALDNFVLNWLKKIVIKNSNCVTVVSNDLLNKVKSDFPNSAIYLMPMGIDTAVFKRQEISQNLLNRFGDNYRYLIFIGALNNNKSIIELIDAMSIVVKRISNIKLLIIGDGGLKKNIEEKINLYKINKSIELLGWIKNKDIPEYMSICDYLILPSKSEGFGLVIAEAISCGLKVIVSNLNNFKDIINNENSVILDNITKEEIAMKILKNIDNLLDGEQKQLQSKYIQDKFSWEVVSKNYSNLIKEI